MRLLNKGKSSRKKDVNNAYLWLNVNNYLSIEMAYKLSRIGLAMIERRDRYEFWYFLIK